MLLCNGFSLMFSWCLGLLDVGSYDQASCKTNYGGNQTAHDGAIFNPLHPVWERGGCFVFGGGGGVFCFHGVGVGVGVGGVSSSVLPSDAQSILNLPRDSP